MNQILSVPDLIPAARREECKFVVPGWRADMLADFLAHRCGWDVSYPDNILQSLYFDTPWLDGYREKESSEFLKWKLRLRWYLDPRTRALAGPAHLETKAKEGAGCHKQRLRLDLDLAALTADPLAEAHRQRLPAAFGPALGRGLDHLRPVAVIRYRRRRFVDPRNGMRVALDQDIGIPCWNATFPFRGQGGVLPEAILEIKGAGARQAVGLVHNLALFGIRRESFSKYGECVRRLLIEGV